MHGARSLSRGALPLYTRLVIFPVIQSGDLQPKDVPQLELGGAEASNAECWVHG